MYIVVCLWYVVRVELDKFLTSIHYHTKSLHPTHSVSPLFIFLVCRSDNIDESYIDYIFTIYYVISTTL